MAASTFCSTDQFDRPTAALLHICIDQLFFDPSNLATNIRVMMHEIGHALGFNSISMAHFRRPDGSPMTKRTELGNPLSLIDCTGPVTSSDHRKGLVPLPSEEILQFSYSSGTESVLQKLLHPRLRKLSRITSTAIPTPWSRIRKW